MRNLTHEELELVSGCGPNIAIGNSNSNAAFTTGSGGTGGDSIFGGTGGTGGAVTNDNDQVGVGQLFS